MPTSPGKRDAEGIDAAESLLQSEEERRHLDLQLRAVYKMEALGQLARGIAHDLNNSLGAISGYADLISRLEPEDGEKLRRYAGQISAATHRSAQIIHKLMTFARQSQMQVLSFELNPVIGETIKLMESSLGKNIEIRQELEARDCTIVGDPGQIQNAIINLALNSRDAMPEGGTLVFRTWNSFIDEAAAGSREYRMTPGYFLCFSVSDSGTGMTEEVRHHLFEPFFTTKEVGKGTGLGLASVYGSVKNHHGYIDVESTLGKGTVITLYLPVNRTADLETPVAEQAPPATKKAHILVVDDEHAIAEMLVELLSWLGYSATACTDVDEALAFYTDHRGEIDLVIADWDMPKCDGLQFFRRLREVNPGVIMLVATGFRTEEERRSMQQAGIAGTLPKPFLSADLSQAIASALAGKLFSSP